MDDAALVAIVGSGEVTPIHLIICICRKNSIQVSRIVANKHSCAPALLGFFLKPAALRLVKVTLIKKSRWNQNTLLLNVSSFHYVFNKITEPRETIL